MTSKHISVGMVETYNQDHRTGTGGRLGFGLKVVEVWILREEKGQYITYTANAYEVI